MPKWVSAPSTSSHSLLRLPNTQNKLMPIMGTKTHNSIIHGLNPTDERKGGGCFAQKPKSKGIASLPLVYSITLSTLHIGGGYKLQIILR